MKPFSLPSVFLVAMLLLVVIAIVSNDIPVDDDDNALIQQESRIDLTESQVSDAIPEDDDDVDVLHVQQDGGMDLTEPEQVILRRTKRTVAEISAGEEEPILVA